MGAHFYCIIIGSSNYLPLFTPNGLTRSNCFAHALSVKRGRGRVGSWKSQSQILGASFAKSADVGAQLLGKPASAEPYTILIMSISFSLDSLFV
jgi:hypothetical protein